MQQRIQADTGQFSYIKMANGKLFPTELMDTITSLYDFDTEEL